jgi:uncharacterized phage protein gp47/JayE
MSFQIKDFPSCVASMINFMRGTQKKITDFNTGAVARTLIEACAIEIDELYQQMFNGLKEGIPVAVFDSFDFAPLLATSSGGLMRLSVTANAADIPIPANTEFISTYNLLRYLTTVDTTIPHGSTQADIYLSAVDAGIKGNIPVASTFTTTLSIAGLVSAVQLSGFTNGRDDETTPERKTRFISYITNLNRGTLPSIEYGLKNDAKIINAYGTITEQVVFTSLVEPYLLSSANPVGWIQAYIHNGVNGASGSLITLAQNVVNGYVLNGVKIPGWKAGGVRVDIIVATEVPVGITGTVSALLGYTNTDVASAVETRLSNYLIARGIGATVGIDDLYAVAKAVPGVNKFVLATPTADITTTASSKVMPGLIAIAPV